MTVWRARVASGMVAVGVLIPVALAGAQNAGDASDPCQDHHPCTAINGFASPDGTGVEGSLTTPERALAESGRPAEDCPEAVRAYEVVGITVHAVIGPCPDPATWPRPGDAESTAVHHRAALAALEAAE